MIARSRKRGNSDETSIETATVIATSSTRINGNSSHVHIGATPKASRNTSTTTRFSPRLNRLVSTTASGITSRGNCVLRTIALLAHDRRDGRTGRLLEEAEQHDVEQQQHRIVRHLRPEPEHLREHREQDAEQHQRPRDRPQVAERGAEVVLLEVGRRDQVEQLERAPRPAAERGRARHVAQRRGGVAHGCGSSSTGSTSARDGHERRASGAVAEDQEVQQPQALDGLGPVLVLLADVDVERVACPGRAGSRPGRRTARDPPAARRPPAGGRTRTPPGRRALRTWKMNCGRRSGRAASSTMSSRSGVGVLDVLDRVARRVAQRRAHDPRVDVDDLLAALLGARCRRSSSGSSAARCPRDRR